MPNQPSCTIWFSRWRSSHPISFSISLSTVFTRSFELGGGGIRSCHSDDVLRPTRKADGAEGFRLLMTVAKMFYFFFSLWRWQIESVMCTRRRWIMHPELPCSHSAACIHRAETDSDNFPSLRRIQKCVKRRRTKMPGKVIFRPTWFCAFRELLSSEGEVCFWRGSEIQVCFQAATSDLLYRVYPQQPGPLLHLPPIIRYSPVMLFTEHWLFFLFLFGPLSHLREREKQEGQREERGKRKSNKQRCIFCIRIHYKSNWIGRDHIWNCSGLQCDHISARCVKAVCPHVNGRKKKNARQVKKVV